MRNREANMKVDVTNKPKMTTQEAMALYNECLEDAKICLETALNNIRETSPFIGTTLSMLDIAFSMRMPTACVYIDPQSIQWKCEVNPVFFSRILKKQTERQAVLIHEIYHIINGHLARVPYTILDSKSRNKMNKAADCSINQLIQGLPKDCIDVKKMRTEKPDGTTIPFPTMRSMEEYYAMWPDGDDDEDDGQGPGQGSVGGRGGKVLDDHSAWSENAGAVSESDALKATEQIIERTIQKSSFSHDQLPGCVKDFLKYSEARKKALNYRALLLLAFKRSLAGFDRTQTWVRQSRRYGKYAKGTKSGQIPKLHIYIDHSGSISISEVNEFFGIVKDFIKVSSNACQVSFFHTAIYKTVKFNRSTVVKEGDLESGGTDLTPVMKQIARDNCELNVILTDGYYSDVNFEGMVPRGTKFPATVFLISKEGDENHPLKRLGTTVKIPKI
jgi:predicted metal-dependent peptidase